MTKGTYSSIPDGDETKIPNFVSRTIQNLIVPFLISLLLALLVFGKSYNLSDIEASIEQELLLSPGKDVTIYQTSIAGDRFLALNTYLLAERGFSVDKISFGNKFLTSSPSQASIDVKEEHQYQVSLSPYYILFK